MLRCHRLLVFLVLGTPGPGCWMVCELPCYGQSCPVKNLPVPKASQALLKKHFEDHLKVKLICISGFLDLGSLRGAEWQSGLPSHWGGLVSGWIPITGRPSVLICSRLTLLYIVLWKGSQGKCWGYFGFCFFRMFPAWFSMLTCFAFSQRTVCMHCPPHTRWLVFHWGYCILKYFAHQTIFVR